LGLSADGTARPLAVFILLGAFGSLGFWVAIVKGGVVEAPVSVAG